MQYLVGTDSVHTGAAACDYLEPRLDDGDSVVAVAVVESDDRAEERDRQEALNAVRVRLSAVANVETAVRNGDVVEELRAAVAERDADELVVGPRRGDPDANPELGGTVSELLADPPRPVTVVPLSL
jgi:nucleotide-binding universal stress UspA family protein